MSQHNRRTQRGGGRGRARGRGGAPANGGPRSPQQAEGRRAAVLSGPVVLGSVVTVGELADAIGVSPIDVIKTLMARGIMASINQQVDFETAASVAEEFGIEVEEHVPEVVQQADQDIETRRDEGDDPGAVPRPPVVTIMGHVDHGKTKLLDAIRQTNVAAGEAGGITQHIGAYQVEVQGRKITFLDTPGHEAFTAMRARGAQVTDIAVLVVAADDGVMPQTREAISHARAADVPLIVALNKIDLPAANPDRVKQQLAEVGVIPEEYGGDVPVVEISAKERLGIDDLLEMILLVADLQELKANPNKPAIGVIIEAKVDRGRGPVATALIQSGTLKVRDVVVVGATWGRVRAMVDDRGRRVRRAEPAMPVEILGLLDVPEAGDILQAVEDEKTARTLAEERARQRRAEAFTETRVVKLDDAFAQLEEGETRELRVVLKADVQGSLEAIQGTLAKLNEESESVGVSVVHAGTGAISESDVNLAVASNAIIVGFNVRPDAAAKRAADAAGVDIRFYDIIYQLVDDIKSAMSGLLSPEVRQVTDGYAEVRQTFRLPSREVAAGLYVLDGKATRNSRVRVLRNGAVIYDGVVSSLKRFKDDVREVQAGYECGLVVEGLTDIQVGDQIEFYHTEQVARTL
ncbi:translation initiation factor IF-2 [Sphaerobacter thermophilus]|uniref:Translation initiation factor IF-2 n=1 Tax=Sphaerobacter thermophilus (strain ATCC 49802 / DSM 20745 / KCCM 41009 / NCIMB 13125 / S 6022) TaxID=479434 RepID=D1C375_SPHTD|nr:translation initiation factor IF-2 [Sphaerobacter thermophilus DSM 20745]PZN63360.1 MAG: translation initiation factor IF-2 [Sphaerobacter thermophilus]